MTRPVHGQEGKEPFFASPQMDANSIDPQGKSPDQMEVDRLAAPDHIPPHMLHHPPERMHSPR
jgi:hypothetical protein